MKKSIALIIFIEKKYVVNSKLTSIISTRIWMRVISQMSHNQNIIYKTN